MKTYRVCYTLEGCVDVKAKNEEDAETKVGDMSPSKLFAEAGDFSTEAEELE